jgi:magnesium chelatase family protein
MALGVGRWAFGVHVFSILSIPVPFVLSLRYTLARLSGPGVAMLASVKSATPYGIEGLSCEVEVDLSPGLPKVVTVGLPDTAVRESQDRVRSAMRNAGYLFPIQRVTVNLAPADIKKEGPAFDLPIAIGMLIAHGQLTSDRLKDYAVTGELALDGRVRPVRGALAMAMRCAADGLKGLIVPAANAREAAVVEHIDVIGVEDLTQAVGFLAGQLAIEATTIDLEQVFNAAGRYDEDFADVKGQEAAKRALTVAAAGGHNVLMIGPPGAGKTMVARRLPTILPPLTLAESLETTRIYSANGMLRDGQALIATRPFRAPHHTVSSAGLVGGGSTPTPGEISLAHHGVLFLDELPEFGRHVLEVLRQPLEEGQVTISRAAGALTFPAAIMLVAAMNPCPCGFATDPKNECHCTSRQIAQYMSRISGPLLDRIDIQIEMPPLDGRVLRRQATGKSSGDIRADVAAARKRQGERFAAARLAVENGDRPQRKDLRGSVPVFAGVNARMSHKDVMRHCRLDAAGESVLDAAMGQMSLSARAHDKILKVARTIADLAASPDIQAEHVAEAVNYRSLDRELWA